jgi:hypothetical protein
LSQPITTLVLYGPSEVTKEGFGRLPVCWWPVLSAVEQREVALVMLHQRGQWPSRNALRRYKAPIVYYFGDDPAMERGSAGPSAFDDGRIRAAAKSSCAALIQSAKPRPRDYADLAAFAITQNRNAILIETLEESEADWAHCLQSANPDIAIRLVTTPPVGTA